MDSIYILGDNLLAKCYDQAQTEGKCLNFHSTTVQCIWESDIQQIKAMESKYKELFSKFGKPAGVVIFCGSYDLLLNNNAKDVSEKIRKLTQHILSSGVQHIIVCSVIDRYEDTSPCKFNKLVKVTNRLVAKNYKDNKNVFFMNVRPPGKPNDFWDTTDHCNLQPTGNTHIYDRINKVLHSKIFNDLDEDMEDTIIPTAISATSPISEKKDSTKPVETITLIGDVPAEKRMADIKDVLIKDYKRFCSEESQLSAQLAVLQKQVQNATQQKLQIATTYETLFKTQLS